MDKEKLEFYGSAKVGERGQISLPVSLRKNYNIKSGDKLLILGRGDQRFWGIMLVKAEILSKILERFEKNIKDILEED